MSNVKRVETYLSPRFAAKYTGLSTTTLRRLLRHGRLTQYRSAGGHRRYALSELQALRARLVQKTQRHLTGH